MQRYSFLPKPPNFFATFCYFPQHLPFRQYVAASSEFGALPQTRARAHVRTCVRVVRVACVRIHAYACGAACMKKIIIIIIINIKMCVVGCVVVCVVGCVVGCVVMGVVCRHPCGRLAGGGLTCGGLLAAAYLAGLLAAGLLAAAAPPSNTEIGRARRGGWRWRLVALLLREAGRRLLGAGLRREGRQGGGCSGLVCVGKGGSAAAARGWSA